MDRRPVCHQDERSEEEACSEASVDCKEVGQEDHQEAARQIGDEVREGQTEEARDKETLGSAFDQPGRQPANSRPGVGSDYCISCRAAAQMRSLPGKTLFCRLHA